MEVPSKEPAAVMPWDEQGWRSRYEEKEELDDGGYGVVHRVVERRSGKAVALKRPIKDESEILERFKREIRYLRRVKHRHVMPILDHADDFSWFTMPLARCSLMNARSEGLFESEIAMIISQVAAGLHAAHTKNIIHRDVKPSNILSMGEFPDCEWVIADFGLVRPPPGESSGLKSNRAVGTRGYLAPETVLDHKHVGPAADVYSLGRTLGWLVTGVAPHEMEKLEAPEPWSELVARMTSFDPRARISTMTEVIAEVSRILSRLRERQASLHGALFGDRLDDQDERILATIIDRAPDPNDGGVMRVTSYDLDDVPVLRPVLRVSLRRLVKLGCLSRDDQQTENGFIVAYYLLPLTWSWADENRARLQALVMQRPSPPDPEDIPF